MRRTRNDSVLAAAFLAAAGTAAAFGWGSVFGDEVATGPLPASAPSRTRIPEEPLDRSAVRASRETASEEDTDAGVHGPAPRVVRDAPASVAALAARLETDSFDLGGFTEEARVVARSPGIEAIQEPGRLADRIALAEILRHVDPPIASGPPPAVLEDLREAWRSRDANPVLACASVRALAAFGDAADRRALLEAATSDPSSDLARLGLAAARGDEAALELASALREPGVPDRRDAALSALIGMATAGDSRITQEARVRCADVLRDLVRDAEAHDAETRGPPSPRLLAALASLDPAGAEASLARCLADPKSDAAAAESAGSALAANPYAAESLDRIVRDATLPLARRVVAAGARLSAGPEPSAEALAVLERARDECAGTAIGRRAAHALESAQAAPRRPGG